MAKTKLKTTNFYIHLQMICFCPHCNEHVIEDAGEFPSNKGDECTCPHCDENFVLDELIS